MIKTKNFNKIDMINGPLIKNIILFSVPIMLTGILQLFYNAADMIVIGQFADEGSVASIGATSSIINLFLNSFIAFSMGTSVLVARYIGAKDEKQVSKTVHSSILLAVLIGVAIIIFGLFASQNVLVLAKTPADIIDRSRLYMQIYFLGAPFNLLYNFGAAILRANGDSRRPLIFLMVSGLLNVALNLIMVIGIGMGVEGVAIATIASQIFSSVLVLHHLLKTDSVIKLRLKKLRIHKNQFKQICRIGIPAALQSMAFAFSNVLIQSSVNSFGSYVVEGNSAAMSIDGFIYTSMNSVSQAAVTFTSQNYGAKNYKRFNKILLSCLAVVTAIGGLMGGIIYLLKDFIIGIYLSAPSALTLSTINLRLSYFCTLYFLCGINEVLAFTMRGLNYSFAPMMVTFIGTCVFRVVWIYTIFTVFTSMDSLYISYPISWVITALVHLICYYFARKKLINNTLNA